MNTRDKISIVQQALWKIESARDLLEAAEVLGISFQLFDLMSDLHETLDNLNTDLEIEGMKR